MKRSVFFLCSSLMILALLVIGCVHRIPQRSLTLTRMQILKRRILLYARSKDQLPSGLSTLPKMSGFDNKIQDAWNREFIYEIDGNGTVTLKSLGKHGLVGGDGENSDIVGVFPSHDQSGKWNNELAPWTVVPK